MTEQRHDDLVFGKYYFIRLCQTTNLFKTGCCFHYIALLYFVGMLRSIGRRSVSADHHILWLDRYSYIWPISCTDRNLMTSTRDDVYDAWGHMLQVNADVEMLWCFEKQWKIRYMSCMFCMMIWWMDCSFLTADSVRADLRITARVSTGAGADRGRSMNIYL